MANETKILLFFCILIFFCAIPTTASNARIYKTGFGTSMKELHKPREPLRATLRGSDELSSSSDPSSSPNFGGIFLGESKRRVPNGPDPIHN